MNRVFTLVILICVVGMAQAQRGKIITPADPPTGNPMDPNGDGYVTLTGQAFSTLTPAGYYVPEFELKMFGLPILGGDVTGDNLTGPSCGLSDVIADTKGYSVYAQKDNNNNLIFRFRLGADANSIQSWQVLVDTDGKYGAGVDPNANSGNPGFELNFSLVRKNNPGIFVTIVDGISNCPNPILSFPLATNFQSVVADLETCGDPDVFYDFYIPLNTVVNTVQGVLPGFSLTSGLRFASVTSQSPSCAFGGSTADVAGVDNSNPLYRDPLASFAALTSSQCPTRLNDLCSTCVGFSAGPPSPSINQPVLQGQTSVSGKAEPGTYIKLLVYPRTGGTDLSPTWSTIARDSSVVVVAADSSWTAPVTNKTTQQPEALQGYDKIVAFALFTQSGNDCNVTDVATSTSIEVVDPNVAPVAQDQSVTTNEDTAAPITLAATDANPGNVLTYQILSGPSSGTLSGSGISYTYTPNGNFNGSDSFTFQAFDGALPSNTATVSITVTSVNDVPVAVSQSATTDEDSPKSITLSATDVEGSTLSYLIVANPSHGTLSGTGASLTYTPNANYNGADSFTFKANDGTDDSNIATVSITVTPVNDAPVANDQAITTDEDTAATIVLTGSDVDGNPLTYTLLTQPANGLLSGTAPNLTYSPNGDYNGPDSFTFMVNDGTGQPNADSNTATVTITVTAVNDVPVANNQSVDTDEDTAKSITLTGTDVESSTLTYTLLTQPDHGTITGTAPNLTYTPEANYFGADAFTFKVNDGTADSNTATVSININSVNDIPVADDQSVTTNEDASVAISVTASDDDGDALTYTLVSGPTNGTLTGTLPDVTYSPGANYNGSDSFTFKVKDSNNADSNTATVSITVTPVNDTPVANNQSVTTNEDTAKTITLTGSDVDGDVLTYTVLTQPTNGTLSGSGNTYTYTPTGNFNGPDNFTFRVSDGTVNSNTATVSITVTAVNDTPVANDQSVSTNEDVAKSITLTATDADGNPLTYSIVTQPANGLLTGSGSSYSYSPNSNYNGSDSFTFKVNDGTVDSNTATVSITVNPVNDTPEANNQSVSTSEDTAKPITLTGSDVDGDALTYTILTQPTNGTLVGSGNTYTYTPNGNFTGLDNFTFRVNDGLLNSNTATVSITVTSVNDTPVANDQSVSTNEDVSKSIILTATDADGNPLTYAIVNNPANGTLSGGGSSYTYTPNTNYNGSDSFTFKANDGTVDSNNATVSITVVAVNDAPQAQNLGVPYTPYTTGSATPKSFTIVATDVDNDPISYTLIGENSLSIGTITGTAPNLIFTPNQNANTIESFTFKVNDGTTDSNIATVVLAPDGQPQPPTAYDQSVTTVEDTKVDILLQAIDVNGDAITFSVLAGPSNGTLTVGSGGNLTYTPNANFNGTDSFTFQATDGFVNSLSNIATVSITVTSVNDAPVANNQSVTVNEDSSGNTITLTATDVDGNNLTYTLRSQPVRGTLSGSAPNLTYTPNGNFNGSDSFTFDVTDGLLVSNTATVSITISPVNDKPVADDQTVTTDEDTPLDIILTGSDIDGDALTFSISVQPSHGTIAGSGSNLKYTPDANYNGPDSFSFTVNDGSGQPNAVSTAATVSITVNPVNDAPVANNQSVTTAEDTDKAITLTATDVDGNTLTYTLISGPTKGTLTGSAPALTYKPNADYIGSDSFTFKVNDGSVDSNTATVNITVTPVNDPPVANNQDVTTAEESQANIALVATDVDGDALTYALGTPAHGTLSCNNCANPVYTPKLNYNGSDSFTFKVNDGTTDSNTATVTITVTPVNDAPIATSQSVTTNEDTPIVITLTGTDVEGTALVATIVNGPTEGTLSGSGNVYTYTPNQDNFSSDSFTFTVSDGQLTSGPATVSINILSVNDLPVATDDSGTTNEDVAVNFSITGNDTDKDGVIDPSTVDLDPAASGTQSTVVISGKGTFAVNASGNLTYTPTLNFNGTASINYTVKDNQSGLSNVAKVTITVTPVNDPPVITPKTVTLNEDGSVDVCFTVTDVENDPLTFTSGSSANNKGTVVINPAAGQFCFTYTPNQDFNGSDPISVTVCDQNAPNICSTGTITMTVTAQNDKPVVIINNQPVTAITATTTEDTALTFCFDATDVEGDIVSIGTISSVSGTGALTVGAPSNGKLCLSYTPVTNATGKAVFTMELKDNGNPAAINTITVEVTVTPINDAPVTTNQSVSVVEDVATPITLVGQDVDLDPLTYTIVTPPAHGTLTGSGANVTYTSFLNYFGSDSFTYKVNDGTTDSNISTVSITVTPVNDPPLIQQVQTQFTDEDTPYDICLGILEPDGDTYAFNPSPVNVSGGGTLVLTSPFCYTFTPDPDFNGNAFWKIEVCDNSNPSLCAQVTVQIGVRPVNDPPVAVDDEIEAKSFVPTELINIIDNDTDLENDPLSLTVTTIVAPQHGTVILAPGGTIIYQSELGYIGPDSFEYQVCDSKGGCDTGIVNIDVGPPPFRIFQGLSPNDDGVNDYWRIDGIEAYPENRVRVFDRYNNVVFDLKNYDNDTRNWKGQANNGSISGNLPEGTYYYIVEINDGNGPYSGFVVLKKN